MSIKTIRAANSPEQAFLQVIDEQNDPIEQVNKFLRTIELRGLSPHTRRAYAYDLVIFYKWLKTYEKQLDDIVLSDLFEFIADQRKQGLQATSINRRLVTIRVFYSFCFNRELSRGPGVSDPAPHYRGQGWDRQLGIFRISKPARLKLRLRTPRKIVESLRPDEVNQFLKKIGRNRDLAICLFMLLCGLRSCEILTLKLESIDWDQATVRILGKGQKERMMPLPDQIINILKRYLRFERPDKEDQQFLFLVLEGQNRGSKMTAEGLRSLFRNLRRISAINQANPHRWRHTFALEMAKSRVRLPVLQKMMGHANPETTLKYINLSMTDLAEEFDRASKEIQKRYEQKQPS
jgi:integrase/recombinase XerD